MHSTAATVITDYLIFFCNVLCLPLRVLSWRMRTADRSTSSSSRKRTVVAVNRTCRHALIAPTQQNMSDSGCWRSVQVVWSTLPVCTR